MLTTHFHAHKPQPRSSIARGLAAATLDSSGVLETLSPPNLQPNHETWTSFQLVVQTSGVQGHESFTSVTYIVSSLPRGSDCTSLHVKRSVSQDWRVHVAHDSSNTAPFPDTVAMAEHFKEACRCPLCLTYLENPVNMRCGYICCLRCVSSLLKEPSRVGVLCPSCSEVSQKNDIRPNSQLGRLVSKIKDLEPQLRTVLQMNPRVRKFQGKTCVCPAPNPLGPQKERIKKKKAP